jgi:hypothetical protein
MEWFGGFWEVGLSSVRRVLELLPFGECVCED